MQTGVSVYSDKHTEAVSLWHVLMSSVIGSHGGRLAGPHLTREHASQVTACDQILLPRPIPK